MFELIRITKIEPIFTKMYSGDLVVANNILNFINVEFEVNLENMQIQGTYRYDLADYEGLSINDYRERVETLLGELASKIAKKGR